LQQRGLVEARPGRGTLIASREVEDGAFKSAPSDEAGLIDLSVNRPATSAISKHWQHCCRGSQRIAAMAALQDYHPPKGRYGRAPRSPNGCAALRATAMPAASF